MRRRQRHSGVPGPPTTRRPRTLVRHREWALHYRVPARTALVLVGLVTVLAIATAIAGYVLAGAVAMGVLLLAGLGLALRVRRLQPAGPTGPAGGNGPIPPGGVGVREPRRPLPHAPAGAAALPLPEEHPVRTGRGHIAPVP